MAFTFMLARGEQVGDSLAEPDKLDQARRLMDLAGDKLKLPVDTVCAAELAPQAPTQVCSGSIPAGQKGLDIGPRTVAGYSDILTTAKTIIWNGPMGVFETEPFDRGTLSIGRAVADATDAGALSIVGGGDSAAAVAAGGLEDRITHISTGGGACLAFLEGKQFEALEILGAERLHSLGVGQEPLEARHVIEAAPLLINWSHFPSQVANGQTA